MLLKAKRVFQKAHFVVECQQLKQRQGVSPKRRAKTGGVSDERRQGVSSKTPPVL